LIIQVEAAIFANQHIVQDNACLYVIFNTLRASSHGGAENAQLIGEIPKAF
jgi:hypothetical protein